MRANIKGMPFKAVGLLALLALCGMGIQGASAQDKLRVGKAIASSFTFLPADVGIDQGIFQKHGLSLEVINFDGGAKAHQALIADGIDVELGSGPELSLIAKSAPTIAIGAINGAPHLTLTVSAAGPIHSIADLKGRKIGITTVASVAEWLPRTLSRQQGWGPSGMQLVPLGPVPTQIAGMKTGEIDGMVLEFTTASLLEMQGVGRIVVDFSKIVPDFHENIFYVRKADVQGKADQLRRFLSAWFETVAYMGAHKAETVKIAQRVLNVPDQIVSRAYDAYMPGFSRDGRFNPAALTVLAQSFVDIGMLPSEPDMSKLYTEGLLSKGK